MREKLKRSKKSEKGKKKGRERKTRDLSDAKIHARVSCLSFFSFTEKVLRFQNTATDWLVWVLVTRVRQIWF